MPWLWRVAGRKGRFVSGWRAQAVGHELQTVAAGSASAIFRVLPDSLRVVLVSEENI